MKFRIKNEDILSKFFVVVLFLRNWHINHRTQTSYTHTHTLYQIAPLNGLPIYLISTKKFVDYFFSNRNFDLKLSRNKFTHSSNGIRDTQILSRSILFHEHLIFLLSKNEQACGDYWLRDCEPPWYWS